MALSKAQLKILRKQLQTEQRMLQVALAQIDQSTQAVELDQNRVGRLSRMDALQGQALAQAGEVRQKQRLQSVTHALTLIEHPDYGRCQHCDQWVAYGRLQIDPTALFCVECAAAAEVQGSS